MPTKTAEKTTPLNIRVKTSQRRFLERAAHEAGKTVSDFVRDAAMREAESTLLERTAFRLDAKAWNAFIEALDAPPSENPRLRDLMTRKAPWEHE